VVSDRLNALCSVKKRANEEVTWVQNIIPDQNGVRGKREKQPGSSQTPTKRHQTQRVSFSSKKQMTPKMESQNSKGRQRNMQQDGSRAAAPG